MDKITFENGTKVQEAYITINDSNYIVTPAVYTGTTPLSASNLNLMQDNIENAINGSIEKKIIDANTTISNGYIITLTNNYIVGNNSLKLYWNGSLLIKATNDEDGHYTEVGADGDESNQIQFYRTSSDGNYTLTEDVILIAIINN